ncbi:MAG: GDSL-type esterase/lipase family protein [Melioribacteraceae bacterium]
MKRIITIFTISFFLLSTINLTAQLKKIKIACIGNSITIGGGAQSYPNQLQTMLGSHYIVSNFGVSGTTMLKKGDFPYWNEPTYRNAKNFDPDIVIIKLGTNDTKPQNRIYLDEYFDDYMAMISEFRVNGKNPQIFVSSPCPIQIDRYGITQSVLVEKVIPAADSVRNASGAYLIDFYNAMLPHPDLFSDGIHPTNPGNTILAQTAYNAIINSATGIIRSFYAIPDFYEQGEQVRLYWETTTGTNVTINGQSVNSIDSMVITPGNEAQYTLITKGTAPDTAIATVKYLAPGKITSFSADPIKAELGAGEEVTLNWKTTNGTVAKINGELVEAKGSKIVTPQQTTTYVLSADGESKDEKSITIEVVDAYLINRALNYPAKALSIFDTSKASYLNDGDLNTVWQSGTASTQWAYIDLGRKININRVVIHWGDNYSSDYHIEILKSNGATSRIYSSGNTGDGGIDDITSLTGYSNIVRVLTVNRNDPSKGLEIREIEIYGTLKTNSVKAKDEQIPSKYSLEQNYPNPFNPETTIKYSVSNPANVSLKVYDSLGKLVRVLVDESKSTGRFEISWNGKDETGKNVSSGIYFCKMNILGINKSIKMVLVK